MQAGHTDPGMELVRVAGNVIEVVLEPGLTDGLQTARGRRWMRTRLS